MWQAFDNDAWPAKYLFDAQGKLVMRWVGEGSYDQIESEIRRLLLAANPGAKLPARQPRGDARSRRRACPPTPGSPAKATSARGAATAACSSWKATGEATDEFVELQKGTGTIVLPFTAGEVNLVVQPGPSGKSAMTVLLDGNPIGEARGADVGTDGVARFDRSGMIRLVAGAPRKKHVLTLVASDPGVRAYVFTFGP